MVYFSPSLSEYSLFLIFFVQIFRNSLFSDTTADIHTTNNTSTKKRPPHIQQKHEILSSSCFSNKTHNISKICEQK
jgi:hypothetical protein